jgi:RNA polymerase sigma factor (TIGR02999 family)
MRPASSAQITTLLQAWRRGDQHALDRLTPLVYEHLRRVARNYVHKEPVNDHLNATALVHEAYLRLVDAKSVNWQDRVHFYAVSARLMRRILVDAARARQSSKRGGDMLRVDHPTADIDNVLASMSDRSAEICALDDALSALASIDPRRAQVIELRFFGGLSVEETAEFLSVSPQTVLRDWKLARAWLAREMRRG